MMYIWMLKSKIHGIVATDADLEYEGSLTLDPAMMEAADLLPNERVDVYNITNGHRFTTYVIRGERGKGECCINGAAAHLGKKGDRLIVVSYAEMPRSDAISHRPIVVKVGKKNRPKVQE